MQWGGGGMTHLVLHRGGGVCVQWEGEGAVRVCVRACMSGRCGQARRTAEAAPALPLPSHSQTRTRSRTHTAAHTEARTHDHRRRPDKRPHLLRGWLRRESEVHQRGGLGACPPHHADVGEGGGQPSHVGGWVGGGWLAFAPTHPMPPHPHQAHQPFEGNPPTPPHPHTPAPTCGRGLRCVPAWPSDQAPPPQAGQWRQCRLQVGRWMGGWREGRQQRRGRATVPAPLPPETPLPLLRP